MPSRAMRKVGTHWGRASAIESLEHVSLCEPAVSDQAI
jgi:hypothetical protein